MYRNWGHPFSEELPETVGAGKTPPALLGVRALDSFTFQADLRESAPCFLMMCYLPFITKRHVIEGVVQLVPRTPKVQMGPQRSLMERGRGIALAGRMPYTVYTRLLGGICEQYTTSGHSGRHGFRTGSVEQRRPGEKSGPAEQFQEEARPGNIGRRLPLRCAARPDSGGAFAKRRLGSCHHHGLSRSL